MYAMKETSKNGEMTLKGRICASNVKNHGNVDTCGKGSQMHNMEATSNEETQENPSKKAKYDDEEHGTLATISQSSKHRPFRIKSTFKGHKVITPVDSRASHNFIDEKLVTRMKLKTESFNGFTTAIAMGGRLVY